MIPIPVASGVTLTLPVPLDAREEPPAALPPIDVSAIPGARIAVRRGFVTSSASGSATLRAACVIAPSDRWAPGLEDLVLARATAIVAASTPGTPWQPGPIDHLPDRIEQHLVARTPTHETGAARHTLAFLPPDHEALLCSVICIGGGPTCSTHLAAAKVTGPLTDPPPPSLLVRTTLLAADHPHESAAALALALAALTALVIARRPRIPSRRFYP